MAASNPSHYYYIKNKSDLDQEYAQPIFISTLVNQFTSSFFGMPNAANSFTLTFKYPGLLVGSGYLHPKVNEEDYQLGFYFDFTSGLPVIPGTSIKGVLKNAFPFQAASEEELKQKSDYIFEKFNETNEFINPEGSPLNGLLKNNLLEKQTLEEIFFQGKQIFFDAYVMGLNSSLRLFETDYITPHTAGKFKSPNPIKFLKVASDTEFCFQFFITEYSSNGIIISAKQKENLFKRILLDFGIGAKRNVGYGQFAE